MALNLTGLLGVIRGEGDLLNRPLELDAVSILPDNQPAVLHGDVLLAGGKGEREAHLRGILRDVYKAAGADAAPGKFVLQVRM